MLFWGFSGRGASGYRRRLAPLLASPRPVPGAGVGWRFPPAPSGRRLDSSGRGYPAVSAAISHLPSFNTTVNAVLTIRGFRVNVVCRDKREPRLKTLGVGTQANLAFVTACFFYFFFFFLDALCVTRWIEIPVLTKWDSESCGNVKLFRFPLLSAFLAATLWTRFLLIWQFSLFLYPVHFVQTPWERKRQMPSLPSSPSSLLYLQVVARN